MDTNKYTEKVRAVPYPERPKKPPFPTQASSPADIRKYADEVEAFQNVKAVWIKKVEEYNKKVFEVEEEFKQELFSELDIVKNPKANLFFSKAWEKGHSNGFSDVWNVACELVDLIK